MPADIRIRGAIMEDAIAIAILSDQLFQEDAGERDPTMNLGWARQHGQSYFEQLIAGERRICFVAEAGNEVIAYLAGYLHGPGEVRPIISAELESMFVQRPWRSTGVGSQLIDAFLAWARAEGASRMSVTAYASNARAVAFYQRAGFQPRSVILEKIIS